MIERCHNPENNNYKHYGARGIEVCREWKESFEAFYKDMGDREKGYSLGRRNNDLGYYKDNCRWETSIQQNRNKQNTRYVIYNGQRKLLAEVCENLGLSLNIVGGRLRSGWPLNDALTKEVRFNRGWMVDRSLTKKHSMLRQLWRRLDTAFKQVRYENGLE